MTDWCNGIEALRETGNHRSRIKPLKSGAARPNYGIHPQRRGSPEQERPKRQDPLLLDHSVDYGRWGISSPNFIVMIVFLCMFVSAAV